MKKEYGELSDSASYKHTLMSHGRVQRVKHTHCSHAIDGMYNMIIFVSQGKLRFMSGSYEYY